MKKRIALMLATIILVLAAVPVEAAAPAEIRSAAAAAMARTGKSECFVIRTNRAGKGMAYMMRKSRGKIICDRSGTVILGKNEHVNKGYTYSFYRNKASEKRIMSWKQGGVSYRQRYTSHIECDQGAAFNVMIHSYVEYKQSGRAWKVCKGTSRNTYGLAMCREFARYLWSCADPECPVIFL